MIGLSFFVLDIGVPKRKSLCTSISEIVLISTTQQVSE